MITFGYSDIKQDSMETVKTIFDRTITQAIKLKLGLDIYEYIINDKNSNFVNFEAELDVDYPIKGTEVRFSAEIFSKWRNPYNNDLIVDTQKDLASTDITSELSAEPFRHKEMIFIYLFTLLEDFGNSLVEKVNNTYYTGVIQDGKSWHSKVNKHAKNDGRDLVAGFGLPFNLQRSDIDEKFVDLLYELKQKRNSIAHELKYPDIHSFKDDIKSLIVIICYLYHINDITKSPVKIYPWYDYDQD
ncbi:hypothetical protein [Hymenobacter sp. CRA2]|uniref:hypothetical protein n=1 Tax=Hymenobacter sp. CRA2 TaxID=1955620 RepID=UPI0011179C02|nr:hypothetical protein [Hymenobacter sp. CRA2]